jgi:polyhydroxyalkanoate synthase
MIDPQNMPIHLFLNMMQSQHFANAWPRWNGASENWNLPWMQMLNLQPPQSPAEKWLEELQKLLNTQASQQSAQQKNNTALWGDIQQEAQSRLQDFMAGAQAFMGAEKPHYAPNYPILWQRGNARLLDIAPENKDGVAILCIPSLINTAQILDLTEEMSVVRQLQAQGFRPMILDWGSPGQEEQGFACADYITAYALDALDHARAAHDGPLALAGYCMGGIFAAAIAQIAPFWVDALVLLATPWDFATEDTPSILLHPATQTLFGEFLNQHPTVPEWMILSIFHLIDPWAVQRKYARFPSLSTEEKQRFIAVEYWANHAIPLTREVANDVFIDWPQKNQLANHQWKVGRHWMEPELITCPTIAFIPQRDRIVPTGCAMPLAKSIRKCSIQQPDAGHVSMLIGPNAQQHTLAPLTGWLRAHF